MLILTEKSIFKYTSSQILDLMVSPAPDSDMELHSVYNNFIQAVDCIYGDQDDNGYIPIFRTKEDTASGQLKPDPDSTLRFLIPGNSYYIKVSAINFLPLSVPNPIGLADFVGTLNPIEPPSSSTCPKITVNQTAANISSPDVAHEIHATITNVKPNQKYYYQLKPVFSNWPAKLSPSSGQITFPQTPDANGFVSGNIDAIFSYYKYPSTNIDSIPYTLNKTINTSYYRNNIYSIINLSVYSDQCVLYDKNINIYCKSCVSEYKCPSIILSSTGSTPTRYITAQLSDLQPDTNYTYAFASKNSNWPANISPKSGILTASDSSRTATLYSVFKYCDDINDNCNLPLTDSSISTDPLFTPKLYNDLVLILTPNNSYCNSISESILLECNKCFVGNSFNTSIKFAGPDYPIVGVNYGYPLTLGSGMNATEASSQQRPYWEYNIYASGGTIPCCDKAAMITFDIDNAIIGEKYIYDIYSHPPITIIPNTGTISFGDGSGNFSVLAYLDGKKSSSVHVVLTHEKSTKQASDSFVIRCPQSW